MEYLRNNLLKRGELQLYESITDFFSTPDRVEINTIIGSAPVEIRDYLEKKLDEVMCLFATDRALFQENITYGQIIIWKEVLSAYRILEQQKRIIEQINLSPEVSNYATAMLEVKKILYPYARMQVALSKLEETLGVDRFLDRVSEGTFIVLKSLLDDTKKVVEKKTEEYKAAFQIRYNTTNVNKVIAHSIIRRDDDNQVCDEFLTNNRQAIVLVVDGFGFCQYLWTCGIDGNTESFTFKENLFPWLSKNHLMKENFLGSSYVTDTGAGLAQIYLGQISGETNIIASKLKKKNGGTYIIETKRIELPQFDSLFSYSNSITDIVSMYWNSPKVYYCSRYQDPPSGFSKCIFKSADVNQVIPSERVFSMVLEDMLHGQIEGLQILYLTNIDNSGHTMGAYSGFEKHEHIRMDYLLRNFFIELAIKLPELFDGQRVVYITADHGMFESSKKMVSRQEIINHLNSCGARNVRLVENNRALLFYNEGQTDTEEICQILKDYFESKKLLIDVQTKNDKEFSECLRTDAYSMTTPDIIARFVGEGLFYSNQSINEHLLHYGGHGGYSVDEVFVPLFEIPLNSKLLSCINKRFLSKV